LYAASVHSTPALVHFALVRYANIEPRALGLSVSTGTIARFALGIASGAGLLLLAYCIAWGAGGFAVAPPDPRDAASSVVLLEAFGSYFIAALFEEIAFRVALVGALRLALPTSLAVLLPAAAFGLLHGVNPNATTAGVVNTVLAGVLLGLLYLERGGKPGIPSLGLVVGLHTAWNFTMGSVVGVSVSGHPLTKRLLQSEPTDMIWSGGAYGLEAGIGTTAVLLLACVVAARIADLRAPIR
jgi:uncharacterized protein